MTTLHLSEVELQQAAEAVTLPATTQVHLRDCRQCQARVAVYQHLFAATASLPGPLLDFDAAALVLAQLPRSQPLFPWVVVLASALVGSVIAVALLWLGKDFVQAFQGLSPAISAAVLVLVGCVTAGHCVELLGRYRRQLSRLTIA